MHLFNCLKPVCVHDHKGREKYVPCGKCEYCRYIRSLGRTERITNEMRQHKYALFVTLTYHDAFLPLVNYSPLTHVLYHPLDDDCEFGFSDTVSGLCQNYVCPDDAEFHLINKLTKRYGGIPVLNQADVQRFMKRLRILVFRSPNFANKDKEIYEKEFKITYAYCGEYGPSTYRPHYHLILMFDSFKLSQSLPSCLRSLWQLGIVSQRWLSVQTEDGHYVAQYLNNVARLPSFFQQKMVAPFFRSSRSGSFGFAKISKEALEESYSRQSATVVVQDMLSGEQRGVSVPIYLANKLYPRFSGFDILDSHDITRLLRAARDEEIHSAKDFERQLMFMAHRMCFATVGDDVISLSAHHSKLVEWLNLYLKGDSLSVHVPFDRRKKIISNLARSIYYCSRQYKVVESRFGVSLSEAVSNTLNFLHNSDSYKLLEQLGFEDQFFSDHPDWLFYIDSHPVSHEVMMSTEFADIYNRIHISIEHSHKNRRKREFLSSHPEYDYIDRFDYERKAFINEGII